jgi:hypothetical protein
MEPQGTPKTGLAPRVTADPRELAGMALTALQTEAGDNRRLVSFSLEIGVGRMEPETTPLLSVRRDRTTSTLSFISLEARVGAELLFSARGVFSAIPA